MLLPQLRSPQAQSPEFRQSGRFGAAVSCKEAIVRRIGNRKRGIRFRNLDTAIIEQNLALQFGLTVRWIGGRADLGLEGDFGGEVFTRSWIIMFLAASMSKTASSSGSIMGSSISPIRPK